MLHNYNQVAKALHVLQSWALLVFLNFTNNFYFAFFIRLILLGSGFLNRTGAKICYQLDIKCKTIIFHY